MRRIFVVLAVIVLVIIPGAAHASASSPTGSVFEAAGGHGGRGVWVDLDGGGVVKCIRGAAQDC